MINQDILYNFPNLSESTTWDFHFTRLDFILFQIVLFHRRISEDQENHERGAYQSVGIEGNVFIHPNSVLVKKQPEYVVYQEIIETKKPFMRGEFQINILTYE